MKFLSTSEKRKLPISFLSAYVDKRKHNGETGTTNVFTATAVQQEKTYKQYQCIADLPPPRHTFREGCQPTWLEISQKILFSYCFVDSHTKRAWA